MSRPPTHSRIRSRKAPSASRVMPASVPAAPFITLTKSSNRRFSDCISSSSKMSERNIGARSGRRKLRAGIEAVDRMVERAREEQPAEVGQHQQAGGAADAEEENGGGG